MRKHPGQRHNASATQADVMPANLCSANHPRKNLLTNYVFVILQVAVDIIQMSPDGGAALTAVAILDCPEYFAMIN